MMARNHDEFEQFQMMDATIEAQRTEVRGDVSRYVAT
jgi:hypothetical protein